MSHSPSLPRLASLALVVSLVVSLVPVMLDAPPANAQTTGTLVINEIDYDQPGTDTAEYLEIKNVSDQTINLDPYIVQPINGANGTTYSTVNLPSVNLAAGDYYVVCGNAANVANCDLDVAPNQDLIQNGAPDAVAILLNGSIVDTVSYEGVTTGFTEGAAGATADTAAGAPAGPEGISRCPDGGDTNDNGADFVLTDISPGAASTGCPEPPPPFGVCGDPSVPIHDVQGPSATSPVVGQIVIVEAVVVGDFQNNGQTDNGELNGFHLQEEDAQADANPASSEGLFVFAPGTADVAPGDLVRVQGTVTEFTQGGSPMTELSSVVNLAVCGDASAPTPAEVTLPVGAVDDFERFEGMSVGLPQTLLISEYFNYDRFGEMVLALPFSGLDRIPSPTAVVEPGTAASDLLEEITLRRITLDDGLSAQNPSFTRHPNGNGFALDNRFRGGDTVSGVAGVMEHSFGLYRVQPTAPASYESVNARPASPEDVGGEVTVASFNVLNYFLTLISEGEICGPDQDQECRGADDAAEFARQRVKILSALAAIDADVFGLIEMENTTGVEPLADIVAGLNAMGAGPYEFIDTGVIGTDAIRVGIIYKPDAISPVGDFAILDSSVDPDFIDTLNRPVLAQTFTDGAGGTFTVAVNHLKSKGSACDGDPDIGDGQGNCNQTRLAAAQAQVEWLASDPTGSGDPDFLIIGDLNSYDMEDPIDAVLAGADNTVGTEDDYTDLVKAFGGETEYSFVFDGQTGYLDHGLSNDPLTPQVSGATEWHINADEPDLLDYDTTFKSPEQDALFEENPFRSSDHDPMIVGLELNASPSCDAAVADPDRLFPANHRFVGIAIEGVTDPDGDDLVINVDSILQDEPVDAPDSGNTSPDGRGVGTDSAEVRAERVGTGNGRVYHIAFTATDPLGLTCSGEVTVAVPVSRRGSAIDDGALFDSTIPAG